MSAITLGAAAMLAAVSVGDALPFLEYPELDEAETRSALAVVEVLQEDYLPQFPQCEGKDIVCMDPPPTWFKARLLELVYGDVPAVEFFGATTSHFGARLGPKAGKAAEPRLMALRADGEATVMPRYSNERVFRDSKGAFHLMVHNDEVVHWLPCGISALIVPVEDAVLAGSAALSVEDYTPGPEGWDPTFFRVERGIAYPRFSIPVTRLAEWLSLDTTDDQELECRSP